MLPRATILAISLLLSASVSAQGFRRADAAGRSDSQTATAEKSAGRTQNSFALEERGDASSGTKTGTYIYKSGSYNNEIKVQELSDNKIRVAFAGNYEYRINGEWTANSGGTGPLTVGLNGNTAVLQMEEYPDCRISLRFAGNKLSVRQEGAPFDCGFGGSVFAGGEYIKKSSAVPNFEAWSFDAEESNPPSGETSNPDSQIERIRFAAGRSSAIISGRITKSREIIYLVRARAGQTMEVKITGGGANSEVVFHIVAPDGSLPMGGNESPEYASAWRGKLMKTGDYKIMMGIIESDRLNFELSIAIR